jgi:hypothetical protein
MLIFKKKFKENKEFEGIFGNISFLKMECSKLIKYLTNMCANAQGITISLVT